jgi:hypothetical protein
MGRSKLNCETIEARAFIKVPVRSAILRVRILSPTLWAVKNAHVVANCGPRHLGLHAGGVIVLESLPPVFLCRLCRLRLQTHGHILAAKEDKRT